MRRVRQMFSGVLRSANRNMAVMCFVFAIGMGAAVFGQNPTDSAEDDDDKLTFQAGSKEFIRNEDGTFINRYMNGVTAYHHDAVLKADNGTYESGPGEIRFTGETVFEDSLRRLFADTLMYYEKRQEAIAIGNVRVYEGDRSLTADHVLYRKDIRFIRASGNVVIRDDSTRSTITGMSAEFNDSTGCGFITGNPYLERIEDDGGLMTVACTDTIELLEHERIVRLWNNVEAVADSMEMSCSDTLEIYDNDNFIRLWKSVVAKRDSLTATSDYAIYNDLEEQLILSDGPEIRYAVKDTREDAPSTLHTVSVVSGDTVRVRIHDKKVAGAVITGAAESITAAIDSIGELYDRSIITSKDMILEMENDNIARITAGGTAESYYHRNYAEDDRMIVNSASGDTLMFFFDEGSVSEMRIFGYGGGLGAGKYLDYEMEAPKDADSDSTAAISDNGEREP